MDKDITDGKQTVFPIMSDALSDGLNKREYFAAQAMKGFCARQFHSDCNTLLGDKELAVWAVQLADKLIETLNED